MTKGGKAAIMCEVQMCAQIDQCIAVTDGMEEVSFLLSVLVISILTLSLVDSALLQLLRLDTIHDHL